jgi:hypothetical protein
VVRV